MTHLKVEALKVMFVVVSKLKLHLCCHAEYSDHETPV